MVQRQTRDNEGGGERRGEGVEEVREWGSEGGWGVGGSEKGPS